MKRFLPALLTVLSLISCRPDLNDPTHDKPGTDSLPQQEPQVTAFPRMHLLEDFTSESCVNCAMGAEFIRNYADRRTDIIRVTHHAGYRDDAWTIAPSRTIVNLLEVSGKGTPCVSIDRTITTFTDPQTSVAMQDISFHPYYLEYTRLSEDSTFASVVINNSLQGEQLHVHVSGRVLDNPYQQLQLSVFILENGLHGKQMDPDRTLAGIWDDYTHCHVIRTCLSDILGDNITVADQHYQVDYQAQLPDTWVPDNCCVIAFLTCNNGREVVQAARQPLIDGTDGGLHIEEGGVTPRPVPEGYPEGAYSVSQFIRADTVYFDHAIAYAQALNNNMREWHIVASATQQSYGSGVNKYIPMADIVFFTDESVSTMPTQGEYTFTIARTPDQIRPATAWAGVCDLQAQRIYGSELFMTNYEAYLSNRIEPGSNGRWLISEGSTITFHEDGFSIIGTSLKGYPILLTYHGNN